MYSGCKSNGLWCGSWGRERVFASHERRETLSRRLQLDCNTSLHILIPPWTAAAGWDKGKEICGTTMREEQQWRTATNCIWLNSGLRGHQESDRGNLWDVFSSPLAQLCWLTGARAASPKTKTDHYAKVALTPDREICSLWKGAGAKKLL